MKKIAIEEHFWTEEVRDIFSEKNQGLGGLSDADIGSRLLDVGEGRLKSMDEYGIDMQVLSLASGFEALDASEGTAFARKTNDRLSQITREHPRRLAGFAALAPQDPDAAAGELERAVIELGLKGTKISSHVRGEYLDNKEFWVIFEKAEKLGVPIYLHPRRPPPDMIKPFMAYPGLAGSMWGYDADASLHAMRLILSGVFDKYPGLKIILGHLGEALPFWLWRIDNRWLRENLASDPLSRKLKKRPSQYVKDNFFVTTSGMLWQPALLCTHMALGPERILFAADYPYESIKEAVEFMDAMPIGDNDKEMIYHANAEKLLSL